MLRPLAVAVVVSAAAAMAGCADNSLQAPTEAGVCWHLVQLKDGKYRFNRLAEHQPNLENCAARLEDMRLRFLRLGSTATDVIGAYQGQFLFLQREGIFTAANVNATRYLVLVRTGDGRLAMPGAVRQ